MRTFEASLRLYSQHVDLNALCRDANLLPCGVPMDPPHGNGFCVVPLDFRDMDLQDAVAAVCSDLAPHRQSLRQLRKRGGEIELSVIWYAAGAASGSVDAKRLKQLGELGIDLAISVYSSRRV
ncbi:hypothetical protein [Cupriavidus plantarum]|uniref:hypothetical protein n=1 Tax=Cupriavidus plantarum TaxID=942865 RepID=UPI001B1F3434|nr:hypothetical protein [Cupriavidus plantarum]CAG2138861.1 hypothetical protein LMG26296_02786 [Cupriavidus plantarum]SMR85804.1 hypothetical protein SAMN05421735_4619 [Cupriavidus plantarum]